MPEHKAAIYGGPTKRFFVSMLTRDIELDDAILDLLDNCVDGAIRKNKDTVFTPKAFVGFTAKLSINSNKFELKDNCGGIPDKHLADAFSLGRPSLDKDGDLPTIGMYGIGMKRAIFKIAHSASVTSIHPEISASVSYSKEWLNPDNQSWDLDLEPVEGKAKIAGVCIASNDLKDDVAKQFGSPIFLNKLREKIAEHFGYIMQRGFCVELNGINIEPITLPLFSARAGRNRAIRPFDYVDKIGDVHVKVSIGFFRPLVLEAEVDNETLAPTGAERAGISVVCNDRVVLLHDRSLKTGWGDGGVPRFHPQFRAIAGLILLRCNDASQLPLSTTKRDLDVGSDAFLKIRQACIEGLKIFTDFTNKWKGMEKETDIFFKVVEKRDANTSIRLAADYGLAVRGSANAKKYKPNLPVPERSTPRKRISFIRESSDIELVSTYLFGEKGEHPSIVGASCFDRLLGESKKMTSGTDIPYQLRPNKFIDRQIFVDLLAKVCALRGAKDYIYASMGGKHLVDQESVYRRVGISNLFSFDGDEWVVKRQKKNVPFAEVVCETMLSGSLPGSIDRLADIFKPATNFVFWLDYTRPSERLAQLQEFSQLLQKCQPGDVARIAMNADIKTLKGDWEKGGFSGPSEYRAHRLRGNLGAYYPANVTNVGEDDLPHVLSQAVFLSASEATISSGLRYEPLLLTSYADGQRMFTATFLTLPNSEDDIPVALKNWDFIPTDTADILDISAPDLSMREKLLIDQYLSRSPKDIIEKIGFSISADPIDAERSVQSYKTLHRYYPTFYAIGIQ